MKENKCIGIIGIGLIGGSVARTLKRLCPEHKVLVYDRSAEVMEKALADKTADGLLNDDLSGLDACDIVMLCCIPSVNVGYLPSVKAKMRPDAIVTDVTSTKCEMESAVYSAGLERRFVGGHPMSGSEKSGYGHSSSHLLENAYYMITPTKDTDAGLAEYMADFAKELGAIPLIIDARSHDRAVAAVSHVPHIVASSLCNLVKDSDGEDGTMKTVAAGGFKDITRIASASPDLWQTICLSNSDMIAEMLRGYITSLEKIEKSLKEKDGDALFSLFDTAREYRAGVGVQSGAKKFIFELYCDIIDESGAIATIATLLASNGISIRDIGIIHNREFADGVLHIAFYAAESRDKASQLLQKHSYKVYIKE